MYLYLKFPAWLKPEIIPGLPFRWYGLMYIVAFGVAYIFFRKQVRERRYPMTDDEVTSLFFWGILGLLLGARIFSTLVYEQTNYYIRQPWLVFWPFHNGRFTGLQGMSYHGGVIGCITGFLLWGIVKKVDVRDIGDMLACSIPIGYTFGRLGNFINAELYGRATDAPVGMLFPRAEPLPLSMSWVAELAEKTGLSDAAAGGFVNLPRHPSQLYEAFFEGIFLWSVAWLIRKKNPFRGFGFGLYIAGYGIIRFFIEYFRQPDSDLGYRIQLLRGTDAHIAYIHPLTSFSTGQILCLAMVAGGALIWLLSRRAPNSAFSYIVAKTDAPPSGGTDGATANAKEKSTARNRRKRRR
ncbi:MAG: prolipoprotein diacylglyceryl transferase [Spirochaetaceae bacterium]|jgi:phosphatidylglycerol:prolipoprotein diacylglycerol transferase|nr:prolipoprotein diacylglyceryl transferase [Spirochaetaceae bacterium]